MGKQPSDPLLPHPQGDESEKKKWNVSKIPGRTMRSDSFPLPQVPQTSAFPYQKVCSASVSHQMSHLLMLNNRMASLQAVV